MEVLDLQKKVYIRNGAKYSKFSAFWYLLVQCSVCGQITIYNSQCMANLTLCSDMILLHFYTCFTNFLSGLSLDCSAQRALARTRTRMRIVLCRKLSCDVYIRESNDKMASV